MTETTGKTHSFIFLNNSILLSPMAAIHFLIFCTLGILVFMVNIMVILMVQYVNVTVVLIIVAV